LEITVNLETGDFFP
jgi:hypothetical protein